MEEYCVRLLLLLIVSEKYLDPIIVELATYMTNFMFDDLGHQEVYTYLKAEESVCWMKAVCQELEDLFHFEHAHLLIMDIDIYFKKARLKKDLC